MRDLDPGTAVFVGGFVAALCWFAALLAFAAGGGLAGTEFASAVSGIALALAGLGVVFLLLGVGTAVVVRATRPRPPGE